MSFLQLAFYVFLVTGCLSMDQQPPTVELLDCSDPLLEGFDECMKVTFHNDTRAISALVGLNTCNQNKNNLKGKLLSEPGSKVSVTKHGIMAFIMISARHFLYKFKFNEESGVSTYTGFPSGNQVKFLPPPTAPGFSVGNRVSYNDVETRALPPQGFLMKVWVLYDEAFGSNFGTEAESRIDEIFNHAETFFAHASLGTSITPVELGKSLLPNAVYTATGENLGSLGQYVSSSNLPDADAYVLLSYENNLGGVIGIAYLASTCGSRDGRVSINEYFQNDIVTAEILVHELGHNLGMGHDFGADNTDKFASDGTLCTGINGYMDYGSSPNQWSRCSVEDFDGYFQRSQPFCMELSASTTTPMTTTATPTMASTTTALTTTASMTTAPTTMTSSTTNGNVDEPCRNVFSNSFCHRIKYLCSNELIQEKCKLTCSVCGDGCYDIWKSWYCTEYSDYCPNENQIDLRNNCQKTCGLC